MLKHLWPCAAIGLALLSVPVERPADDWDKAEKLSRDFVYNQQKLRDLTIDELRALVKTLCDADEEERKSVAHEAADRMRSDVMSNFDALKSLRDDALSALDVVLKDEAFKSRWDKAREYRDEIAGKWESVQRITTGARGGNNPVVSYMLKAGQEAHEAYQKNSTTCTVFEFKIGSGFADCINASTCSVIELKPNNSRGASKGAREAKEYTDALNGSRADREELVKRDGAFKNCTTYTARFALYTFCPEITNDGEMRSTSVGWTDPQQA